MLYSALSLNGAWRMDYCEEKYDSQALPEFKGSVIEGAVPSYWEDMTESFMKAPFFRHLRINPEYGLQQYPIADTAPDMALPNIVGNFFYSRTFICEDVEPLAVLHFGGVQSAASVWLNGEFLIRHEGYSSPFDVEIPRGLLKCGENTLVLSVSNHRLEGFDSQPVSGITSRAASEYSGGVIGDIELRMYRSPLRDVSICISEDCKTVKCAIDAIGEVKLAWSVLDGDKLIKCGEADGDFCFDCDELELWSPECPKTYILQIDCDGAAFERSFGVRRLTVDGPHFRLNGEPYYLRGVCEHCYYPMTVHPVQNVDFYREVIRQFYPLSHSHPPCGIYAGGGRAWNAFAR